MTIGPRILLVEPDSQHATLITLAIDARHLEAVVAVIPDPREALAALRERRHDIVVVDYQLAGLDGLKFLELLREHDIDTPVILLSSQISEQVASEAVNFGASEYVVKEGMYHLILPRLISEAMRRHTLIQRNRELEERLKVSENLSAITITAATLAHEISNPLTTIIGVSELLSSDQALRNRRAARRKLRLITTSAGRIRAALDRMSRLCQPVIRHTCSGHLVIEESALSSKKTGD